jgi:hypothetical protein
MNEAQVRREDCRTAVLQALYDRQQGAHEATTLRSVYLRRQDWTVEEVEAALHFLKGLSLVDSMHEALGSTLAWQITSQGILHIERQ